VTLVGRIEVVIRSCVSPEHFNSCRRWIEDLAEKKIVGGKEAEKLNYIVQLHYNPNPDDSSAYHAKEAL